MSSWYWLLILLLSSGLYLTLMIALGEDERQSIVRPLTVSRELACIAIEEPGYRKLIWLSVYLIGIGFVLLIEIGVIGLSLSAGILSHLDTRRSLTRPSPPPPQ